MNGTVKTKTDKGFGFIAVEGSDNDIFFHSNSLVDITFDEIQEGDEVTFDKEETPKGLNAANVRKV